MPLQDSDNFIIGRGTDSYKITYQDLKDDLNYVPPPVLNLEVGKGSISPSSNLEEGDTLTGSATVTDAENPVVVHVWELDGVEVQRGSESTYVADAGSVRYRKEVTDDNNQSPVIGAWSDAVTVEEAFDPTVPNATMNGLRFDSERSTKLNRAGSGTGTISYWKKDSSTSWVWQHEHQTGAAYPAEIGASYNGYMSDYYFVDGQDLPAETFVGDFEGKTGPLDSSKVLENIGYKESPADSAPNYAEKWSATSSGTLFSGTFANVFDGNLSTFANVSVGAAAVILTEASITAEKSIEFYASKGSDQLRYVLHFGGGLTQICDISSATEMWNSFVPDQSPIVKITQEYVDQSGGGTNNGAAGIRVDGRVLIDGPADTSQVWSTNTVGAQQSSNPASNAFDGKLTTYAGLDTAANSTLTTSFSGLVGITSLRISAQIYNFSGSPSPVLKVNGVDVYPDWLSQNGSITVSGTRAWVDLGSTYSTLDSVEWGNSAADDAMYVNAIEVDGKLLIDAPAVWNTSQVWSESLVSSTGGFEGSPSNAFDGDSTTRVRCDDAVSEISFVPTGFDLSYTDSFEVRTNIDNLHSSKVLTLVTDAGSQTILGSNLGDGDAQKDVWAKFTANPGKIISLTSAGTPGVGNNFFAFKVDGAWLVDKGNIGANGFYLPFDPEATGETYSDKPGTLIDKANLFDGNLGSYTSTSSSQSSWTMNFSPALSGPVRINVGGWSADLNWSTNEDSGTVAIGSSGAWVTLYTATAMTELTITRGLSGDLSQGGATVSAIEADGKLLIDHNSIGVDASGQDNHFADQNFAVGNTDKVWSQGTVTGAEPVGPWTNLFDGDLSTRVYAANVTDAFTQLDLSNAININGKKVEIYGKKSSTSSAVFSINNIDISSAVSTTNEWQDVTSLLTGQASITILKSQNGGDATTDFFALRVDGEVIVDGNIQDTVLDTPMKNYAVLETGKNGNLVATANGTDLSYTGEAGKNYYYEVNGTAAMHPGSSTFSSQSGWVYNFGQQPFAGTITQVDDSQVWSNGWDDKVFGGGTAAFDGNVLTTSANTDSYGSGVGSTLTTNIPFSSSVVLHVCTSPSEYVKVNGTQVIGSNVGDPDTRPLVTPTAVDITSQVTSPITEIFISRESSSGSAYLFGVEIDGKLLVNTGAGGIPISRDNLLYQTWEQYARTALGYAVDRIAKLEQRNLNLEALVEEARTRLAALELNEVSDDAVDTALITLIGNINDRLTALEGGN